MKKTPLVLIFCGLALLLAACGRNSFVCPPPTGAPQSTLDLAVLLAQTPTPGQSPAPTSIEIRGKTVLVDRVIDGPLCNDTWRGKIYVGCGVQVAPWTEEDGPKFLEECNFTVEPGTVVYVAAHNNEAYYKGCSCHTGENPIE